MNILVGITGGIAAYKSATLIREFRRAECDVKVIMTTAAKDFITPLTLATLSGNPIYVENFNPENGEWNSHISLGQWADAFVIAPATANTIAKMCHGVADNLLLTTYLSARCPVWIAPAMDLDMFAHKATQNNINTLKNRGVKVIEPTQGFLASGLEGKGRMAEPQDIAKIILKSFDQNSNELKGRKILLTVGGTVENIDPVRFISNHSSGKMGIAIANEMADKGAQVILIKANTTAQIPASEQVKIVNALSAQEMYEQVMSYFNECDIAVFAAAVADYTPANKAITKIKHTQDNLVLQLVPTTDIAAQMGKIKNDKQITIGFALETDNEKVNAQKKLVEKNLDAIVLNSMSEQGAGFGVDTNKITIIDKNSEHTYPLKNKTEVAKDIVEYIIRKL